MIGILTIPGFIIFFRNNRQPRTYVSDTSYGELNFSGEEKRGEGRGGGYSFLLLFRVLIFDFFFLSVFGLW